MFQHYKYKSVNFVVSLSVIFMNWAWQINEFLFVSLGLFLLINGIELWTNEAYESEVWWISLISSIYHYTQRNYLLIWETIRIVWFCPVDSASAQAAPSYSLLCRVYLAIRWKLCNASQVVVCYFHAEAIFMCVVIFTTFPRIFDNACC